MSMSTKRKPKLTKTVVSVFKKFVKTLLLLFIFLENRNRNRGFGMKKTEDRTDFQIFKPLHHYKYWHYIFPEILNNVAKFRKYSIFRTTIFAKLSLKYWRNFWCRNTTYNMSASLKCLFVFLRTGCLDKKYCRCFFHTQLFLFKFFDVCLKNLIGHAPSFFFRYLYEFFLYLSAIYYNLQTVVCLLIITCLGKCHLFSLFLICFLYIFVATC